MGPWAIPTQFQHVVKYLYERTLYLYQTPAFAAKLRADLVKALSSSLPPHRLFPSNANYVLARLENRTPAFLQEFKSFLLARKIIIRDASDMPGLDKGYFRFAVKRKQDIASLREALIEFGRSGRK